MGKINSEFKIIFCFISFGAIGVISRFIPLTPQAIVFYRAFLGALFIILFSICKKRKVDFVSIKNNFHILLFSGIFLGINWLFQFIAMRKTSVSVATICYNTAPVFMIILSPIMFKEKLTLKSLFCIILSMFGIILISDVLKTGFKAEEIMGVLYGLLSAIFYALTVCVTKTVKNVDVHDKVSFQFIIVSIIFFFMILFNKNYSFTFSNNNNIFLSIILLLILSVFITGYIYIIYFDCVDKLPAQTTAILTYIDPVVSIVLSYLILSEHLSIEKIIGAILILISSVVNEFYKPKEA